MIEKGYVTIGDGQIHFRRTTGGHGNPLVMFHMTSASSEAYEGLMEELDGKIPVIAFDTMNYGASFRTDREPSIRYIAEGLLEAITALGIDRFHTLGHHTGVSIQCEMAIVAPDRVLSVLMSGPNYATMEQNAYLMKKLALPNPISIKGTQFIFAWSRTKDNFPVSLWTDDRVQAAVMNRETVDMLRAGENWPWAYRAVFSHDLRDAMSKVHCPKFFICGGQDLAYAFHREAVADYPDAPIHEHPDGGIYYLETHPQDAAPAIMKFLSSIEQ